MKNQVELSSYYSLEERFGQNIYLKSWQANGITSQQRYTHLVRCTEMVTQMESRTSFQGT